MYSSGPYSEELHSDIATIRKMGLGTEEFQGSEGHAQPIFRAVERAHNRNLESFRNLIQLLSAAEPDVLEIAATYDLFREMGDDHAEALRRIALRNKGQVGEERLASAIALLSSLGLSVSAKARHAHEGH